MANIIDVATYILETKGPMTAMKLQKLVYYAQAWSLVWEEAALFDARIEAWANGPVAPDLYRVHQGMFQVSAGNIKGNSAALSSDERETVDSVLKFYGDKTAHYLSELTHAEDPWKNARQGLEPGEYCNREISLSAMAEYYSSL